MARTRWNLYLFLALVGSMPIGSTCAFAASAKPTQLEITSDRLEMDDKGRVATFSGHVLAVEGEMRLRADQMQVRYTAPAAQETQKVRIQDVQATGHVVLDQADYHGTADVAIYRMEARTVELLGQSGHAVVQQGGNRLEGERILLSLTADRRLEKVVARGNGSRQVKALLNTHSVAPKPVAGGSHE
ncbi:MAG: LptA/OstA family protein [Magnetococcales bacterium]|nr:LptA/OstA family protein [Magnetococcales bacterium]